MRRHKRCRPADETDDDFSKADQVCEELRAIQWETNCSTQTLQRVLDSLRGNLGALVKSGIDLPRQAKQADKKMQNMVSNNFYLLFCFLTSFFVFLQFCFPHSQGKERCFFTVVWDQAVAKSGVLKMFVTCVNCVVAHDMMAMANPVNL